MPILIKFAVGVGAWLATSEGLYEVCPHTGDEIVVEDEVVFCEKVRIHPGFVEVTEKRHFPSEKSMKLTEANMRGYNRNS